MKSTIESNNKLAITRAFNRAAHHYERYATLQKTVGYHLIEFAQKQISCSYPTLLDAGAGTGYFSRFWQSNGSTVTAADIAPQMLVQAKNQSSATYYKLCDIESLPFMDNQFSGSFSNLSLQWCENLPIALTELYRVTQKNVMFTTLIEGSLFELAQSSLLFDGQQRINHFLPLADILQACQFAPLRWQVKTHTLIYSSLYELFGDLKGTGANYVQGAKRQGLSSKQYLQKLEHFYRQSFADLRLSYRVFYGVLNKDA